MQDIIITTPQNVKIKLFSSILGWRILSFFIDFAIIIAYIVLIIYLLDITNTYGFNSYIDSEKQSFLLILLALPVFFYSLITEFLLNGRTVGKAIIGLKVLKINGYHCSFTEYLLRWLFRMIDIYPFLFLSFLFGQFGYVFIVFIGFPALLFISISKKSQRLGDMIAGTTVVRLKKREHISSTIFQKVSTNYQVEYPQAIKLSDNDMRIIKDTYEIALKNRDYTTIHNLKLKVESVIQTTTNKSDTEFLKIVIKDFNYLTKDL